MVIKSKNKYIVNLTYPIVMIVPLISLINIIDTFVPTSNITSNVFLILIFLVPIFTYIYFIFKKITMQVWKFDVFTRDLIYIITFISIVIFLFFKNISVNELVFASGDGIRHTEIIYSLANINQEFLKIKIFVNGGVYTGQFYPTSGHYLPSLILNLNSNIDTKLLYYLMSLTTSYIIYPLLIYIYLRINNFKESTILIWLIIVTIPGYPLDPMQAANFSHLIGITTALSSFIIIKLLHFKLEIIIKWSLIFILSLASFYAHPTSLVCFWFLLILHDIILLNKFNLKILISIGSIFVALNAPLFLSIIAALPETTSTIDDIGVKNITTFGLKNFVFFSQFFSFLPIVIIIYLIIIKNIDILVKSFSRSKKFLLLTYPLMQIASSLAGIKGLNLISTVAFVFYASPVRLYPIAIFSMIYILSKTKLENQLSKLSDFGKVISLSIVLILCLISLNSNFQNFTFR